MVCRISCAPDHGRPNRLDQPAAKPPRRSLGTRLPGSAARPAGREGAGMKSRAGLYLEAAAAVAVLYLIAYMLYLGG